MADRAARLARTSTQRRSLRRFRAYGVPLPGVLPDHGRAAAEGRGAYGRHLPDLATLAVLDDKFHEGS